MSHDLGDLINIAKNVLCVKDRSLKTGTFLFYKTKKNQYGKEYYTARINILED